MPPSLVEWLPPEHPVFFVIEIIEDMREDLAGFHRRQVLGGTGRAGYDPLMLVTVLVYAMWQGVRSSRQIEARCRTDVAFRIACAQDPPDHSTIARFRQVNAERMEDLFIAVLLVCAQAGMGRFGKVAIDGSKVKANASIDSNVTLEHLRKLAEAEVAAGLAADADDEVDVDAPPPPSLRDRSGRAARLQRVRQALEAEQAGRDKAAQTVRDKAADYQAAAAAGVIKGGRRPVGVDPVAIARARYERLVATQQAKIDEYQAEKAKPAQERSRRITAPPTPIETNGRVKAARANLQRAEQAAQAATPTTTGTPAGTGKQQLVKRNLSDPDSRIMPVRGGGFVQGYNVQAAVSDDHVILAVNVVDTPTDVTQAQDMMRRVEQAAHIITEHTGRSDTTIGVLLYDAGYDSNANLTAPGPDRLIANAKRHHHERNARTNPTTGPPPPDATPRQAMDHRLRTPEGITAYHRRSATVETVFGHLKAVLGIRQLLTRGLTNATGEINLAAATFNLRRLYTYIATQAAF